MPHDTALRVLTVLYLIYFLPAVSRMLGTVQYLALRTGLNLRATATCMCRYLDEGEN